MGMHETPPVEELEPVAAETDLLSGQLPDIAIAGAVGSEEEMFRVSQIATITRWLRLFSLAAEAGRAPR